MSLVVTSNSGTSTTPNAAVPSNAAAKTVMWLTLFTLNATDTDATISAAAPAGFEFVFAAGTQGQGSRGRILHFWKRLTATDSGSYTFGTLTSSAWEMTVGGLSNAVTVGKPWNALYANTTGAGSSATTQSNLGVTPGSASATVIAAASNSTGGSWTPPSGFTEDYDAGAKLEALHLTSVSAAATGNWTSTCSGAGYMRATIAALSADDHVDTRSGGVYTFPNTSASTIALTAHEPGDRITIVVAGKPETTSTPTITSGWTLVKSGTAGAGSLAADTGQMFYAVFMRDVVAGESSSGGTPIADPTVTPNTPNTWIAAVSVAAPQTGMTWRDSIAASAPFVQLIDDTDATSGTLAGTAGSMTGNQPTTGDALHFFPFMPTDSMTSITAQSATCTGLADGTVAGLPVTTNATTMTETQGVSGWNKTSLNNDCSMGFFDWVEFNGTASAGVAVSLTMNGTGSGAGGVIVIAHRQTTGGTTISGGQATSTSTAQAGTVISGSVIAGGMATSVSTALAGAVLLGYVIAGGQATETDTAQAGTIATGDIIVGGQAAESDTALAGTVAGGALVAGGQASETDAALTGATLYTVTGGTASELDAAQAGTIVYVVHGGQATETDAAQTGSIFGGSVEIAGGQASETDIALAGAVSSGYLETDTSNNIYAVTFEGDADVTWEPAVVARPALLTQGDAQVMARKFESVTVSDDGMATYTGMAEVAVPRHRNRVLIGNEDWTFKYGHAITVPDYELIDPLMYGDGGTLVLPQINARFERLGVGRLKRVKLGAKVWYQRVDDDPDSPTYNQVVATDYKGLILRDGRRGDALTLAVGGELLGRAAMKWHPVPIFRKIRDAAVQLGNAVVGLGLKYEGRFDGLGINLASRGGMYEDQYLLDTLAQLVTGDGDQWTVMPTASGAYTHSLKDRETVHATVVFDNELATPDLGDDLAEKINRVWVNAVAPDGQRIMHATAPRLLATPTPERPTVAGGPMTIGDTNADTSTGDGVTVLVWRLAFCGLLDLEDVPGGFDEDVADAVREFQKTSGCANLTGSVDAETWNKLWDNAITDYSIAFAAQRPAVEADEVQKFDRSGSGSIIGLHDGYDPKVPIVDLPADMGMVGSRRRAYRMARHKLHQVGQSDWVGQIVLTSGLISGEWNPGDALTTDRVIPNRAVRPGWNLWEPFFDGGTLFPVVASTVSDNGWTVTLLVDTRARPAMEAWAVHQRNRENRYQMSRYLGGRQRRTTAVQDTVTPWDKIVGQTDRDWPLVPGWNVIPVPAGQVGTVSHSHIQLDKPMEFAALVAESQLPLGRLNAKIEPLAEPPSDPQKHVVAITGRATGGTFKLANDALDETAAIAHDATASSVQAAIRGLGGSFAGATVSGDRGGPYTVNMRGAEADLDVADNSLTGGSSPSISVTTSGPLTGPGTPWWGQDDIRRWLNRYGVPIAWGTFEKPCGYGEYQKTHPDGTPSAAPLVGKHLDEQSFGYDCGVFGAVLYLYIWVGDANTLPRQRIFRQQLDGSGT